VAPEGGAGHDREKRWLASALAARRKSGPAHPQAPDLAVDQGPGGTRAPPPNAVTPAPSVGAFLIC